MNPVSARAKILFALLAGLALTLGYLFVARPSDRSRDVLLVISIVLVYLVLHNTIDPGKWRRS